MRGQKGWGWILICLGIVLLSGCTNRTDPVSLPDKDEAQMLSFDDGAVVEIMNGSRERGYTKIEMSEQDRAEVRERGDVNMVYGEPDLYRFVLDNPLDNATGMFEPMELNMASIRIFYVWRNLWRAEIDQAMAQLQDYLEPEEYLQLSVSQLAWEEYMADDGALNDALYRMADREGGGRYYFSGSATYPLVTHVQAEKTRARAIELWSYIYAIPGCQVNMAFQAGTVIEY